MKKINSFLIALSFVWLVGCSSTLKEKTPSSPKEKLEETESITNFSDKEDSINRVDSFLLKENQVYSPDSNQSMQKHPSRLINIIL